MSYIDMNSNYSQYSPYYSPNLTYYTSNLTYYTSNLTYYTDTSKPEFTHYSPSADLIIGIFGILLGIYTIVANTLVLAVISKFERRTNSEIIFANLAITDVVGGLDAIFASVILLAGRTYFNYYFLDDVLCQLAAITWCIISISTPLMLALTSLGRFLAIFLPYRYEGMFTKRNVLVSLAMFWVLSTAGGTMHLYKLENTRMEPRWGYCDYRLVEIYSAAEVRIIVVVFYCLPLALSTLALVLCNTCICVKLLQMRVSKKGRRTSVMHGLQAALSTNVAVGNAQVARKITITEMPSAGKLLTADVFNIELCPSSEHEDSSSDSSQEEEGDPNTDRTHVNCGAPNHGRNRISGLSVKLRDSFLNHIFHGRIPELARKRGRARSAGSVRRRERGKKELNIIVVTVLFSLNFVLWNCIMLYYYFGYLVYPSTQMFKTISGGNLFVNTYLNGWFYYATFLTSCVNPLIHFVCNGKMRKGLRDVVCNCVCSRL